MKKSENRGSRVLKGKIVKDFCALSRNILRVANKGIPIGDFLKETSKMIFNFSDCDGIEIFMVGTVINYHWNINRNNQKDAQFKRYKLEKDEKPDFNKTFDYFCNNKLCLICKQIINQTYSLDSDLFTDNGSFWVRDTDQEICIYNNDENQEEKILLDGDFKTIAIIKFVVDDDNLGLLMLKSKKKTFFTRKEIEFYEGVIQTLGVATADRRAQADLRERMKELACLYKTSKILEETATELKSILQQVVEVLPPTFQYPEITSAEINLDKITVTSKNFKKSDIFIQAYINADDKKRGKICVYYNVPLKNKEEYFFLAEEKNLLEAISNRIALMLERRKNAEEKAELEQQLRHADRLATIGQLSAGVAHELNEPLGNILGFAQLIKKTENAPEQIIMDSEKIEKAALHAREIIKKLMLFAKQMPPRTIEVTLNEIVDDGLYFLESRCQRAGIVLHREFEKSPPSIIADPSQLNQVLVNLVVNAIHAMPDGGELKIKTSSDSDNVYLEVRDNGMGMEEEIFSQIFLPFFTTKDINQGTGLGLPVVHGIVTAHNGKISVESKPGNGTTFLVELPVSGPETKEIKGD